MKKIAPSALLMAALLLMFCSDLANSPVQEEEDIFSILDIHVLGNYGGNNLILKVDGDLVYEGIMPDDSSRKLVGRHTLRLPADTSHTISTELKMENSASIKNTEFDMPLNQDTVFALVRYNDTLSIQILSSHEKPDY